MYCGEMLRNYCRMSFTVLLKNVCISLIYNMGHGRCREKRECCLRGPYSLVDTYITVINTGETILQARRYRSVSSSGCSLITHIFPIVSDTYFTINIREKNIKPQWG